MMAGPDTFHITIKGKGGHAALPYETIDSIAIGAQVVTNLQHIVSRQVNTLDPLVLSVAKFTGGSTHNVIPGSVEMVGTVRSFNPDLRDRVPELMERVVKGVTEAHGAEYEFAYDKGYRPVINDQAVTKVVEELARDLFGESAIDYTSPSMVGEDFSAYQQKAPGTFIFVGAGNVEKGIVYPHHHERFTVEEAALEKGVQLFVHGAFKFLNGQLGK
jgi:amidohydrolase